MKIRNGFVSNSSSSSFVIALPKSYKLSEEELEEIRDEIENHDCYFSYYEELAEEAGETELTDERERIEKMLQTGKMEEEITDPVTDEIKNRDIQKGLEYLTINGCLYEDYNIWSNYEIPYLTAAICIARVLTPKTLVASFDTFSDGGQILNILAEDYVETAGMKILKKELGK